METVLWSDPEATPFLTAYEDEIRANGMIWRSVVQAALHQHVVTHHQLYFACNDAKEFRTSSSQGFAITCNELATFVEAIVIIDAIIKRVSVDFGSRGSWLLTDWSGWHDGFSRN